MSRSSLSFGTHFYPAAWDPKKIQIQYGISSRPTTGTFLSTFNTEKTLDFESGWTQNKSRTEVACGCQISVIPNFYLFNPRQAVIIHSLTGMEKPAFLKRAQSKTAQFCAISASLESLV